MTSGVQCPQPVRHRLHLLALLTLPLILASQPQRRSASVPTKPPPSAGDYIGDAACQSCHANEFATFQTTVHHLTSRPANPQTVLGSFDDGTNLLKTSNPSLTFKMTGDDNGLYQTAVDQVSPIKNVELTQRIDIAVGSGRKAQTYLYWKDNDLFELPVSYWVKTGQWINSPGYVDGAIRFDRPIYPRCLECHGTAFTSLAPPANRFDPASLVLGIFCERCHGPAKAHAAYYQAHRDEKRKPAQAILTLASLPRARQVDTCAICHAGLGKPLAPALSFVPGNVLDRYLQIPPMDPEVTPDVHGNQVQLLQSSKCFVKSNMTCTTCHNVHQVQREAAAFSTFCLNCHQAQQCGKFATLGERIKQNCVDCHMPLKQSNMLTSDTNDQTLQLPVRTHRIAVYSEVKP